ncbi:hypothetical protein KBB89_03220 [Candidatus Gracilibacteria bacterium]|nr:hypothetical protein [Candidatus Gracilibacteria bacterium]
MNPTLIKLAQFVARRPKDGTIRLMHIITGFIIIGLLWWSQDRSVIDVPFMGVQSPETEKKIEYALMILGLFFIVRGIITACMIRQKLLRWKQALHGLALIIVGGPMMDPFVRSIITPETTTTGGFQIDTTVAPIVEMSWHPGIFLVLLGIFWIFVGMTGKGTTSKCIRYGEVVKKIRV